MALLMEHQNIPLTHASILPTIWGAKYGHEPEYLRFYVKTLRKKIEDDPAHPEYSSPHAVEPNGVPLVACSHA